MSASKLPTPSSGTQGFFQHLPTLSNQFHEDPIIPRILALYIPHHNAISADLTPFATHILSPHIFTLIDDAERHPPTFTTHTTFGQPKTVLRTSSGWKELSGLGIQEGVWSLAYDEDASHLNRVHQFLKYHLWTGSCAITTCPGAMSDGAARLLSRHVASCQGEKHWVFREAYKRLVSRDPSIAWTSGQWMTERSGGSDVRGTETVAAFLGERSIGDGVDAEGLPLGPWSITGFKWFSSATDGNMTVLLARTEKGVSAFFAPMRRMNRETGEVEFNGVRIQRLKPKLGTRPVPTAELVLEGMRGWLIGREGEGTKEIATVLNITRVHTAVSSLGLWGRGLAIDRAYAKVRKVEGRLLMDNETHLKTLVRNHVSYAGHMHLGFFVVALLGIAEHQKAFERAGAKARRSLVGGVEQAIALLRLLTPVAKAQCSKMGIYGLQECMESLGGVGYLEDEQEINIARLYRDNSVNAIWEGTTDVMASDVVRVMKGRDGEQIQRQLNAWVDSRIKSWSREWSYAEELVRAELGKLEEWWMSKDKNELNFLGREILQLLTWVVATVLLIEDASRDGSDIAKQFAHRWIATLGSEASTLERSQTSWQETSAWDRRMLFGNAASAPTAKL